MLAGSADARRVQCDIRVTFGRCILLRVVLYTNGFQLDCGYLVVNRNKLIMAQSVNISVESIIENVIQEISYDGTEIYRP